MKIQVIKPFKWCIGGDIYPSDFALGVYEVDEKTAVGVIESGFALPVDSSVEAKEPVTPKEDIKEDEGWEKESHFLEGVGEKLSVLPQEPASQEKIAPQPKPRGKKAGA
jgi:hypothetical protein